MEPVDVILLTMNSERKLKQCINSIYQNVPVNRLIVVDGGSTDRTLEIVEGFNREFGNVNVIDDRGTRATARQKGIDSVTTDWFVFVDSDAVLCRDWYNKALKHVDKDVGAVWGIEVWSTLSDPRTLKMFLWITMKIFDIRGGTHDTLVRTEAVRGIKIPESRHVFEDAFIKNYIIRKGYRVMACYVPFCIHYRPQAVWTLQGSFSQIIDTFKYGSAKLFPKLAFAYGFYTVYSVYQMLSSQRSTK